VAAKLPQEATEPRQDYLDRLTIKIDRAYKRLSHKDHTTPRQLHSIGRLFSLRAICLAEQRKRLRPDAADAIRREALAESSASRSENSTTLGALVDAEATETMHALGWHNRLFGED